MTLEQVRRLHELGLDIIPLKPRDKIPAFDVLPRDENGQPTWEPYKTQRATDEEHLRWFGNGADRNAGIICSELVVVESDTPEAETWCANHLPRTPMKTQSARGVHRFYRRPTGADAVFEIPPSITVEGIEIEIKRNGQYVVAPGSVHPGKPELGIAPGHVYSEVEPWPTSLDAVPEFPVATVWYFQTHKTGSSRQSEPLPKDITSGGRNNLLFREGCRLRRLGWSETEIAAALVVVNRERCQPPLESREVETIAHSCGRYEPATDTFPLTESGDAEFFATCFGDDVRYDHRRGRWLFFNEHYWEPQTDGKIYRLALEAIRARQAAALKISDSDLRRKQAKWATDGEARKRQLNLLAIAQNVKPIADAGDSWDTDPWLLGAENGIVDLTIGTLRAGRPEDRITMRVRAPFDPLATCPLFDKTVAEIFANDADLIAYFDRYVGYSLTGDCREETIAFCWGEGANGKGTLMNTLGGLLGDYADDLPFSALELQNRSGIPNDIAKIAGKRFVTSSETAETRRLNEARVKALTGRDPITARFLHQEFFTFQPVAKFWLATNQKPEVRDTSVGFWRRIHLIPFTESFTDNPDRELKDKLRAEGAGILARAVRGCLAWQREGLNPPKAVREATESYRADSMPLARFYEERCVLGEGKRATFGQLFDEYVKWHGDSREPRLGKHAFGEELRKRFETDPKDKEHVVFLGIGAVDMRRGDGGL